VATEIVPASEAPKTPEQIERDWYENVYQGDRMPQLTVRATIMGMLLGAVLSTSNVYVGLKLGWSMGVAITACISAWVIFATLHWLSPRWFPKYSILENNAMQSCASAAGYMTGAGLVNAIPALMMLDPGRLPQNHWLLVPWIILISWLGVFLAIPAKRQMINIEQLPYPSGIAAATTLKSLHGSGPEAKRQATALGLSLFVGALTTWLRDAKASWLDWYPKIPATWGTSWIHLGNYNLKQLTLSFEGSLLFVAAGAIISFRQAWSMLLGAVVNYAILAPMMLDRGVIETASFGRISRWSLWIGVPMMVTSGLLLFFMQWRTVVRAFSSITAFLRRREAAADDPLERIEVPGSWFVGGMLVLGAAVVWMGHWLFQIEIWMGILAVIFTLFLVLVAARAVGETDITPTGPLSKITQLTFGAIAPGNITTNLMTANISAGSCSHAGDLLTDLKSGYLLGANPRQQFFAQFFGVLAGGLAVVPVFFAIVTSPDVLATEQWPAPAALVWRGVAELLSKGVGSLHWTARLGLVVGGGLGILLPLLETWFPKHRKWIPSPVGLGIAFTINGFNSISMFIGALLALVISKLAPAIHKEYTVPVSSGIIAGESLMGVLIAILTVRGILGE
jgi:putative OPT family oligopeptide transporter